MEWNGQEGIGQDGKGVERSGMVFNKDFFLNIYKSKPFKIICCLLTALTISELYIEKNFDILFHLYNMLLFGIIMKLDKIEGKLKR